MNIFELPKNSDFEKILKKNLEHTNPLEMKEKEVGSKKMMFPFWKPVNSEGAETCYDYDSYLSKKEQKIRSAPQNNTGAVKPKSTFKTNANGTIDVKNTYEDNTIVGKMNGLITKINSTNLTDNTGVVKSQSEDMPKGKIKPQITQDGLETSTDVTSHAAKPKGDNVGIVKPKSEGMPKGTTKIQTTQDGIPTTTKEESFAAKSKGDNVGVVKPKTEDKKVTKVKPTTTTDTTQPTIVEKSNAAKPKGDNVGVVKSQDAFDTNINMVDFTRYMK